MKKDILRLLTVMIIYMFCNSLIGQDYEIRSVHNGGGLIAIEARFVGAGAEPAQGSDAFLDLTLDLRWPADADLSMGNPDNTGGYGISKASVETVDGGDVYQGYALSSAPVFLPVTWTRDMWIELFAVQSSSDGSSGETVVIGELGSNSINPNIPNFNMSGIDFVPLISGDAVLPVELIFFDAKKINETSAEIFWSTVSEINTSHYTIERSTDAYTWTSIQEVVAAGFSSEQLDYKYTDHEISFPIRRAGNVYYRLKMVDFDGDFEYSLIKNILFRNNRIELKLYPNPTSDILYIDTDQEIYSAILYDSRGEVIAVVNGSKINMAEYSTGIYLLGVTTEYGKMFRTVVKVDL